ncbi:MAG TPA: hypothetical protein VFB62_05540 [Polyangiaceae bacterium]|jgi:hypothetical protein|nr:hypothetical protein [Polyangiaceae bacterium]
MKFSHSAWMVSAAFAAAAALGSGCDGLGSQEENVGAAERQIIGLADPYPADATMREREELLQSSMKARREMAWGVVAKILAPVKLKAQEIELHEEGQTDAVEPTIARFETWYQKDELKRMFLELYKQHGKENRQAKAPFSDVLLYGDAAAGKKGIFEWNANYLAEKGLPEDIYRNRLTKIQEQTDINGLTGAESISYSPALFMHLFKNYKAILDCLKPLHEGDSSTILDTVKPGDLPIDEAKNFTLCFNEEFPIDAAVTKAFWSNDVAQPKLPVFDTSAAALTKRLTEEDGGWGTGDRLANPGPDKIHVAKLATGATFRLSGLHIITKELRHWVWITLFWSDQPDSDFGADRPDFIRELGGPWSNYKMAVVTGFEDKDPDPRAGNPTQGQFDQALADAGLEPDAELTPELATMKNLVSLGDALQATYREGSTWAANPYLEEGPRNARSNCIGCHQHAGTPIEPLTVLFDEGSFPKGGNAMVRKNFPADYLWVFDKKSRLARIIQYEVETQDRRDAQQ